MKISTRTSAGLLLCALAVRGIAATDELPPIGTIDFYGLRNIPESSVRALLPFKPGDRLGESGFDELKSTLPKQLDVSRVAFAAVCCTPENLLEVFVGVQEAPVASPFRAAPKGTVRLPAEILAAYDDFTNHLLEAIQSGQMDEDDSQGHALTSYPAIRAPQEKFKLFARRDGALLLKVLRDSSDGSQRAVAAHVLGYAPDKAAIVGALTEAASDQDSGVRNNATRAVAIISTYAVRHPELRIEIDPLPFVRMLNSVDWSDLNKGAYALDSPTQTRDPSLIRVLRGQALHPLIDMCRWQTWGHAAMACSLLRRITGLPEDPRENSRGETLVRAIALAGADGPEPPLNLLEPRDR